MALTIPCVLSEDSHHVQSWADVSPKSSWADCSPKSTWTAIEDEVESQAQSVDSNVADATPVTKSFTMPFRWAEEESDSDSEFLTKARKQTYGSPSEASTSTAGSFPCAPTKSPAEGDSKPKMTTPPPGTWHPPEQKKRLSTRATPFQPSGAFGLAKQFTNHQPQEQMWSRANWGYAEPSTGDVGHDRSCPWWTSNEYPATPMGNWSHVPNEPERKGWETGIHKGRTSPTTASDKSDCNEWGSETSGANNSDDDDAIKSTKNSSLLSDQLADAVAVKDSVGSIFNLERMKRSASEPDFGTVKKATDVIWQPAGRPSCDEPASTASDGSACCDSESASGTSDCHECASDVAETDATFATPRGAAEDVNKDLPFPKARCKSEPSFDAVKIEFEKPSLVRSRSLPDLRSNDDKGLAANCGPTFNPDELPWQIRPVPGGVYGVWPQAGAPPGVWLMIGHITSDPTPTEDAEDMTECNAHPMRKLPILEEVDSESKADEPDSDTASSDSEERGS